MPFCLNQKILVLMAEAELSAGWYSHCCHQSKGPRKRQPEAKDRETVILIPPRGQGDLPHPCISRTFCRKGQGVGEKEKEEGEGKL